MDESGRDHVEPLGLEPTTVVRSRRPRALWGVLALVAVAAGALVVTSADDDGNQRPGLPVAFGSAGGDEAASASMAADSMLAWITYVAGDDLPSLGGEAPAYRLSGSVTEEQVRALADALGLEGELVHEESAWRLSADGGTLEVYEGAGAQWWFSSVDPDTGTSSGGGSSGSVGGCEDTEDAAADCFAETTIGSPECGVTGGDACPSVDCPPGASCAAPVPLPAPAECPPEAQCEPSVDSCKPGSTVCSTPVEPQVDCAVDESGNVADDCIGDVQDLPGPPPIDLPEGEARSIALELLERMGIDVDDAIVTMDGPYEAWYATVEPRLDGVPSGLLATVAVGPEGVITSAGGYLGTPDRLGDYPRLDTGAVIDRANDQQVVPQGGDVRIQTGVAEPAQESAVASACAADSGETTTTVCEDVVSSEAPVTTFAPQCKVQPDGREICELIDPGVACPPAATPGDEPLGAPETLECTPPPEPGGPPIPLPEPQPLEVVLTSAEPALVLLPAIDGTTDAYLVPAYRFTDEQGGRVDLPAVDDASLTGPPAAETTVPPEPVVPEPGVVEPTEPCEVLVEQDSSGTTHTVQPDPGCTQPEPVVLPEGEQPEVGVGYYVDVDVECAAFALGDQIWRHDVGDLLGFATPHEGGTFTLDAPDHGTFVGDAEADKTATFVTGTDPEGCQPTTRG